MVRGCRIVAGGIEVVRLLWVGLALVIFMAGCGGGESASQMVEALVKSLSESDYEAAYDSLHPAHQAIISEAEFVRCGQQQELSGTAQVDEIDITREYKQTRSVRELGDVEVTTVSVNLTQGDQVFPRTWDVVKDNGEWRWVMDGDALDAYWSGRCTG